MHYIPDVVFRTRVRDENLGGPNPYRWKTVSSYDLFSEQNVVVFGIPGAFTPTCTNVQLPAYEELYEEFMSLGVDRVCCVSVNDAFVMNRWARELNVEDVEMIPDGNATFTRLMGMLVDKSNLGFGMRSWRYSMYVEDYEIQTMFVEDYDDGGPIDLCETDPYEVSDPDTMLHWLNQNLD